MVDLVRYAEIIELIAALEPHGEALMANELEMFSTLKQRYETPVEGAFDDLLCLQLMQRNLAIRKGLGLDPQEGFRQPRELAPRPDQGSGSC